MTITLHEKPNSNNDSFLDRHMRGYTDDLDVLEERYQKAADTADKIRTGEKRVGLFGKWKIRRLARAAERLVELEDTAGSRWNAVELAANLKNEPQTSQHLFRTALEAIRENQGEHDVKIAQNIYEKTNETTPPSEVFIHEIYNGGTTSEPLSPSRSSPDIIAPPSSQDKPEIYSDKYLAYDELPDDHALALVAEQEDGTWSIQAKIARELAAKRSKEEQTQNAPLTQTVQQSADIETSTARYKP